MRNIIVVSDLHCGCRFGLCPPEIKLDEGGVYKHSRFQAETWRLWLEFWNEWVPMVTKKDDYIVVVNGDSIDGVHHGSTTQISQNMNDQRDIAIRVLEQMRDRKKCKDLYMIRGTEVHVGKSGCDEEEVAKLVGAVPNDNDNHARWDMWMTFGEKELPLHFSHHVGTTSSAAYESTAVYKELVEAFNEAGRWGNKPPALVCRSHRHRNMEIRIPTSHGYGIAIVTPGWQLKTPFVHRIAMGRAGTPHIGGIVIRDGKNDGIYTRSKVWELKREQPVVIPVK